MRDSDIDVLSADALQEGRPRNAAAERLRHMIDGWALRDDLRESALLRLDDALAAERRATVSRVAGPIRAYLEAGQEWIGGRISDRQMDIARKAFDDALDEVAR